MPVAGDVGLAVQDILGREVAVLVNERKGPGSYGAGLDEVGFAGGVYSCTLAAGNASTGTGPQARSSGFLQTRKVFIVKQSSFCLKTKHPVRITE